MRQNSLTTKQRALLLSECFLMGFAVAILFLISLLTMNYAVLAITILSVLATYKPVTKRLTQLLNHHDPV